MRILAVGGGSGGHVTPVVPVLDSVKRVIADSGELEVRFICDKAFMAQSRAVMDQASMPVKIHVITAGKLRRYHHFRFIDYVATPSVVVKNVIDIFRILVGFFQSVWLLLHWRPSVVFAKGGYVCLPVGLAARLLRVPLVIHDSDARPGLTNRVLGRFSQAIATGYPLENYHYPTETSTYTGVPIRSEFTPIDKRQQAALKRELGFSEAAPLVAAMGGGLGALSINNAMIAAAPKLVVENVNAYVVAGKSLYGACKLKATPFSTHYKVVGFTTDLYRVLAAADIVVTRASATSLQELAGLKKAIIAVPARALSDQHKNADVYSRAQAAVVLTDDELAEGRLETILLDLLQDDSRREALAMNLHAFARPKAASDVAAIIIKAAKA